MQTSDTFSGLVCTETGDEYDADVTGKSEAGAPLDPTYDLDRVEWDTETLAARPFDSMWRYRELLPFSDPVTANEGATPLVEASALGEETGVGSLLIKDEGRNPTGTFLDRGFSLAATAAREADAEVVAHASPGNGAQSAASYAGLVDVRSYGFVPSRTPFPNKAMVNVHGGQMKVVGGRYPAALSALHEKLKSDWYTLQEFDNPYRHDGAKTIAYEIAERLDWTVPDWVVVPVATGELVYGVYKGFRDLSDLGLVDDIPRLVAAQSVGCSPIATAWEAGNDETEAWNHPDTIVGELEIPDPKGGSLALRAIEESDGAAVTVGDDDALQSAVTAAQTAGVEVGAAGGVALAAAWDHSDEFEDDDTVVVVNTESGTKNADILRSHLMGQGI
ncbi:MULTISPECIES: pyridoxal-phosphate dependent enzyme [Haloferax]|uniref:Pyridoxal-phosphate dependent enzyme n=2 Tax=Haloferax TaxID=2251 RepID=A0A6G1Z5K4_9EURY|nr:MULTISPECIES: pyridoxal-phosphate dependent enzyme [Haloferax]KAB1189104.1 pyridoxal-phosphate dependent enzyme [Haloferax sp. CBA1149]MRW81836.1 pyridoxal-phosphate dependent enzyme [Haloferax marinisediminis]